jgi:DNA-binding NtrC family response regulator
MANPSNFGTVLLVEDHPGLRRLVKQILQDAHFTVIPASNAKQAMRIEAEYPGTIDLLLSDVRLPKMSGPKLAIRLKAQRPLMRVALMSGYPRGALLVLNCGWQYLEKPFAPSALVRTLKDMLLKEPERPFRRVFTNPLKPAVLEPVRRNSAIPASALFRQFPASGDVPDGLVHRWQSNQLSLDGVPN